MLPEDYEPEDLDLLNVLKAHTNNANSQSTGHSQRIQHQPNGEIIERFPAD